MTITTPVPVPDTTPPPPPTTTTTTTSTATNGNSSSTTTPTMTPTPSTTSSLTNTIPISDSLTSKSIVCIASPTTTYFLSRFESDIVSSTMNYDLSTTMSFTTSASAIVSSFDLSPLFGDLGFEPIPITFLHYPSLFIIFGRGNTIPTTTISVNILNFNNNLDCRNLLSLPLKREIFEALNHLLLIKSKIASVIHIIYMILMT